MKIHLVGPFRVTIRGHEIPRHAWTGRRCRQLIKLLALSPQGLSVDELIDVLWPDTTPERARLRLYEAASRVRRTVTQAFMVDHNSLYASPETPSAMAARATPDSTNPGSKATGLTVPEFARWPIASCRSGYQLQSSVWVDVMAFHDQVAHLRQLYSHDRRSALDVALRLTPPSPEHVLVEDAYEDWALAARERVHGEVLAVYRMRAQLLVEHERHAEALEALLGVLTLHPICESTARRAMQIASKIDDRGTALAVFERLRDALQTDIGVEPTATTIAVYDHVASGTISAHPVEFHDVPSRLPNKK